MSTGIEIESTTLPDPTPEPVSPLLSEVNLSPEVRRLRAELDRHPRGSSEYDAALTALSAEYEKHSPSADPDTLTPEHGIEVSQTAEPVDGIDPFDSATPEAWEALGDLRQNWGTDFPRNLDQARGVVTTMASKLGPDVVEVFDHIGSHPTVVATLYEWSQGRPGPTPTPAQAQEIITLVRRSEVYQRGDSPARQQLLDALGALYAVAYPA